MQLVAGEQKRQPGCSSWKSQRQDAPEEREVAAAGADRGAKGRGERGRLQAEARSPGPHVDPRSLQDWEKWHCKHLKEQKPRSRT